MPARQNMPRTIGVFQMDASSQFKNSLPTPPERLMAKLTSLDISFTIHTHPPLRTVEDAKAFRGDLQGAHIKNLYLRDRKKRNFLLVVEEDKAIDLKALPGLVGSDRLSFGSAERLFEMLGVRPGAVSPFTLINDPDHKVQLLIDAENAKRTADLALIGIATGEGFFATEVKVTGP